jgi:acyl-CoA reductase-like NAD-dependent aldehyde dehydrogenase
MYKPSEYATLTGLEIERLLKEAGVPEDIFHIAIGAAAIGELLLDLPFDGYFFTGSYKTGKYIYERVSAKMVPCQCELGGKDPLYVADDIKDIKSVAAGTADGAFYNNGQSCCAVERIYVHEKVYDEYLDEFVKEVKSWKVGAPTDEGVYIGPLTRKQQLNVVEQQVKEAKERGAVILTGGERIAVSGYYFQPTVLTNVSNDMLLMQEESFGPVIGIMKVKDDQQAIEPLQVDRLHRIDRQRVDQFIRRGVHQGRGLDLHVAGFLEPDAKLSEKALRELRCDRDQRVYERLW